MVERSLSMREALGSMPRFSIFLTFPDFGSWKNMTVLRDPLWIRSYSSVGQSVRLITVRSAVQARVGAPFLRTTIFQFCSKEEATTGD